MFILTVLGWPYYWLFPRLVVLYALSKAFKKMKEIQDEQDSSS